jgi:hypothetical protein
MCAILPIAIPVPMIKSAINIAIEITVSVALRIML